MRALEPPHTQPNFIMREMGYRVARKHAQRLRKLALLFAFAVPIAMLLLSQMPGLAILGALLATLSMALGLLIERWLFFAEAEHVVHALLRRRCGLMVFATGPLSPLAGRGLG